MKFDASMDPGMASTSKKKPNTQTRKHQASTTRRYGHKFKYFSDLFAKMPFGLVVLHFDDLANPNSLRIVAINDIAARSAELSPQEAIGQLLLTIAPRIQDTNLIEEYVEVVTSGIPRVIDNWHYGDGRDPDLFYRIHAFPLADNHIVIAFEDVSSRKQAEETIEQIVNAIRPAKGEDFFRALVLRLGQACHADMAFIGRVCSPRTDQIQTLAVAKHGQLIGNFVYDLKDTPCEQVIRQDLLHVESSAQKQFPNDSMLSDMGVDSYLGISLVASDNTPIGLVALLHSRPLTQPDQAKTILRVVAARAAAELARQLSDEALQTSEAFLHMAQHAGNVGSWQWDLETNSVTWSDTMYSIYGLSKDEFDGTLVSATRTMHPDDLPTIEQAIQNILEKGVDLATEYRVIRPNGAVAHLWSQSNVVRDANGKPAHVIGTVIDLTSLKHADSERKQLEAQILQTQKLESLGVLAGGIAHDFNNILTGVLGYTNLAMQELPANSTARPLIGEAVKAAQRAADLTKQMLAYAGRGQLVVGAINLNDLIADMASLLQVSLSKKCALSFRLMPALPAVEADAVQLRQIVMNLVINAAEAIGDQTGVITVETGVMHCDSAFLATTYLGETLSEGEYVYVQVSDSGGGMSADTRARIFDPFFTTKFTGRGLGLAAVLGIVRSHRGAITVDSTIGTGTVFKIVFPFREVSGASTALSPSTTRASEWRGSGTVLVIDDEEAIRSLAERMLQRLGFTVLTACDGYEGVRVFRQHAHEVRFVLLDMTMPNLDGEETFAALRAIRSDVRAVLSSGYDEQSTTRRFANQGLAGFLQKPYTYEQLMEMCRAVLKETHN